LEIRFGVVRTFRDEVEHEKKRVLPKRRIGIGGRLCCASKSIWAVSRDCQRPLPKLSGLKDAVAMYLVHALSLENSPPCAKGAVAHIVKSGLYNGVDVTGAKLVWAGHAGNWSYLYVDASEQQKEAAAALAKAAFSGLGKVEALKSAQIDLSREGGTYKLTVDGGKTLEMTTEPVLGGDQKTPIVHSNTVVGTVLQARTVNGSFHDGPRSLTWADSNSYFNEDVKLGPMLKAE
jgi:hypothetical protein